MSTSGKYGPLGLGQDCAYNVLGPVFIGGKVVSCYFQVFYCDNKESLNAIRCTE